MNKYMNKPQFTPGLPTNPKKYDVPNMTATTKGREVLDNVADGFKRGGNFLETVNKSTVGGMLNAVDTTKRALTERRYNSLKKAKDFKGKDEILKQLAEELKMRDEVAGSLIQLGNEARQRGKEGLGAVGSTIWDVGESVAGNLSAVGISAATGINPLAIMGAQGMGQNAYQAEQKRSKQRATISKRIYKRCN